MAFANNEFRRPDDMTLTAWDMPRLAYIWHWFCDLNNCREIGMAAGSITHREIAAWSELCAINVSPAEVNALRRIDQAYLEYNNDKTNPKQGSISDNLSAAAEAAKAAKPPRRPTPAISKKGG